MTIRRLYPDTEESGAAGEEVSLEGLYLGLNLHRAAADGEVLIYSNYVASLDGRISRFIPDTGDYEVPASLANGRDWRLYQELAAQSDVLITSARYFRHLSSGTAQDMLPVGSGFDDLRQWRADQGLAEQPAVVILSRTLEIPLEAIDMLQGRDIHVFTSANAPAGMRHALENRGVRVTVAGESDVEGVRLKEALICCGFKSAYMIAGPEVHRTLIEADVLDQLFLSTRFTLLGSEKSHGFCEGELSLPHSMRLQTLYLDTEGEQLFGRYIPEKP
ncbi:MAG: dihydrofolate reductase family protein [Mariprofundaceae bacterium]|nr:dihydrofolate reductase family protein [Mariprofundaceae bacterium]